TPSGSLLGGTDQTIAYPYMEFGAVGARRVIREFRSTDLAIEFEAKRSGSGDSGVWNKLVSARIGGVSKAASKLKAKYVLSDRPEVKVAVQTNELGEFEVLKAEALFNVTNPGYTQYVADLAAWEEESASIDDEATKTQAAAAADDDSSSSDATTTTKAKAKPTLRPRPIAQPEVITEIVPLSLDVETHGLAKMSSASLERSRDLLQRMDADDTARIARHSTSNNLESLVYQLRDMAEDDDAIEVTSESQRRALEDAVSAAAEWLEDNVESAPLDEIEAQIASLKALEAPITYRRTQRAKRAGHIDVLRSAIAQAEGLVSMYRAEYSAEELGPVMEQLVGLEDALDETVQWLDATTAQQDALQPYEEPVLTTEEMGRRAAEIEKSLTDLVAQQVKRIVASATNKQSTTEPTAEADDNKGNGGGHEEL
ncbi:lumenal Hsp70 protein, partial [Coemansia sp. RSA 1933]